MTTQQPESLRVSGLLRVTGHKAVSANMISDAILAIESQHARITELESQLAQRFDAADMATAAARGFRDGVASVARFTDAQIASVCMSFRHDFGLLDDANKAQLVDDARSWEYAFAKEREWAAADGESNE